MNEKPSAKKIAKIWKLANREVIVVIDIVGKYGTADTKQIIIGPLTQVNEYESGIEIEVDGILLEVFKGDRIYKASKHTSVVRVLRKL